MQYFIRAGMCTGERKAPAGLYLLGSIKKQTPRWEQTYKKFIGKACEG